MLYYKQKYGTQGLDECINVKLMECKILKNICFNNIYLRGNTQWHNTVEDAR